MKPVRKNRLMRETSPYLLQHATNPVDWYGWGPEAFGRAARENKPIFLSVGYAACHWCHVMEKESFEDAATAELMNKHFVNVKVDREERPDVDAIYMSAVQAMSGQGGWPMSVFLTPELKPFFGGTYYPVEDRMGMPSFKRVLTGVANAWRSKRQEVLGSAEEFTKALCQISDSAASGSPGEPTPELLTNAIQHYKNLFDSKNGGFGTAPKFFHVMDLRVCLRAYKNSKDAQALEMVETTLDALAKGGIFDHLGGGFHRYSTDARWFAPHFEKMLYDNALLTLLYVETFQVTGHSRYLQVARRCLDYVLKEMTSPDGGFYSTQDADTEGLEGKFYVWEKAEVCEVLGDKDGEQFCELFNVGDSANWEHGNILFRSKSFDALANSLDWDTTKLSRWVTQCFTKLYDRRAKRPTPFRDEKIIVSWNGLMISAMAKGFQVTGDPDYLEAAQKAARLIKDKMWKIPESDSNGLMHSYKDREPRLNGYLDDYASLLNGLVDLYESDFDDEWLEWAYSVCDYMISEFWDEPSRSFFFTSNDHEKLITRTRDYQDGATPSSAGMAVSCLVRLGRISSNKRYIEVAESALKQSFSLMQDHPTVAGQMLIGLNTLHSNPSEIVVSDGEDSELYLSTVRKYFLPSTVVSHSKASPSLVPMAEGRNASEKAQVYICKNYACESPISQVSLLEEKLKSDV